MSIINIIKWSLPTCLVLGACTSPAVVEASPLLPMPASIEAGLAEIDRSPACSQTQTAEIAASANASPQRPQIIRRCIPTYPEVLESNGYVAACIADFKLSGDGVAMGTQVQCNTVNYNSDEETSLIANAMFVRAMERVVGEMRFAPASQGALIDTDKNIRLPLKFAHEGMEHLIDYPEVAQPDEVDD